MSAHLGVDRREAATDRPSAHAHPRRGTGSRHHATEKPLDPTAVFRRPTCLLAIGIHEVERTAGALRFARVLGNDELARRVEREQEGWSHLYEFTCQRICPALRVDAIEPEAASVFADAALVAMPATVPDDILAYLRRRLATCAGYRTAGECPFLNPPGTGAS